ncbi:hypothetical protein OG819_07910 [Streptomyces sp. NBC_01549]|uniref:hypothetical protein n=1 Tax=Streptomyces sp. NBC_01549 TaxID=2975874 RepID=UPI00225B1A72|nr:hypothetical protein [Streptomyces sp. NBC_01549]MCX4589683.1 hypothetical protein [Streptomyces sp. NBC_01549]
MTTVVRGREGRRRTPLASLSLPLLAVLLAGCGIRSTQVPTDFGPAPSRVPCAMSGPDITTQTSGGIPVQVFLLCSGQLVTVDRSVRIPDGTAEGARRVLVAQGLLDELAETPSTPEQQAGYTTDVRGGMTVSGPRRKDPEDALRLSTPPQDLTPAALAQIICTFSDSAAAQDDGSVILGGPDTAPLRRYECPTDVRANPTAKSPPSTTVSTA